MGDMKVCCPLITDHFGHGMFALGIVRECKPQCDGAVQDMRGLDSRPDQWTVWVPIPLHHLRPRLSLLYSL
jgi:hypothetical protein